jgi:hypothetical protein
MENEGKELGQAAEIESDRDASISHGRHGEEEDIKGACCEVEEAR